MNINNNTLLIVPNILKNKVLKRIDKLINFKIMSLEEFIRSYYFDYDSKTIYYLIKNHHIKYDNALIYLNNLYFIEDKDYDNKKLNKLVSIKKELDNNKLLKYNELFKQSLKNKEIVVYGYDYIDKKYKTVLDELGAKYLSEDITYNNPKLYEFKTSKDEIDFLLSKIIELKEQGISLNNIKIVKNEYMESIKKVFDIYDINYEKSINIYSTNIVHTLLENISGTKEEIINKIQELYDLDAELNFKIYSKIVNLINKYAFIDNLDEIKDILEYELKHSEIKIDYEEQIEFVDLENNLFSKDDYVFLLGFNIGIYPNIKKDEDYITDNIKSLLNMNTTLEENSMISNILVNKINSIKNIVLTYKTKEDREYYVSTLNEKLGIEPIKDYEIPYYINLSNKLKLASKLDLLSKYKYLDKDIDVLYSNYKDIPYNTYDNAYTKIDRNVDNILLSYSSMDNYYKCPFKYYVENVLKLNIYEERFVNIIGNLFHYVLSKAFSDNFDYDKCYKEYLDTLNKEFSNKEKVFLTKLKEDLKLIIDTINKQLTHISLDKSLYEEEIWVNKNSKVKFKGFIDKLMYKEDNDRTLVAIIDYKTGNPNLNLNNIIYGLDMQLPVYLYLTKNSKLKNVEIVGFYLQKILNNEINIEKNKTYLEQKEDNLKLQGYSVDNVELLEQFDDSYSDSKIIKSMKTSNKGFYAYSKVLTKDQIDKIITLVDEKIDEASSNILNNKFDIEPKSINGKNISCEYCKYKDICYMKKEDIVYLKEYKNLEFLK